MAELVTGMFLTKDAAERAVTNLQKLGCTQNEISVMMSDQTRARQFALDTAVKATEGAGMGAGIGGALGALVALLTAGGAIMVTGGAAVPLVAGPLAAALAGAGVGGLGGGLVGGLIGAGISEERARAYEATLYTGGILIGVHTDSGSVPRVRQVLEADGAVNMLG
jgi:surface antigen